MTEVETEIQELKSRLAHTQAALSVMKSYKEELGLANQALQAEISERKKAEEALRTSEKRYRDLVEMSPEAILIHRNGQIVYVNASALHLFGATRPEEILGRSPFEFFHPDYHAIIYTRIEKVQQGFTSNLIEEKIIQIDGTIRDVEVIASPFEEGLAVQVILRDITARKQAEKTLEEAKLLLDTLMESVPIGITIADAPDIRIKRVSRYGQEILGGRHNHLTAEEVASQWRIFEPDGVTPIPNSDLPLTQAIVEGKTIRNRELIQVNASGESLDLLCNAAPFRDKDGKVIGSVVAWHDISELKKKEAELSQLNRTLKALNTCDQAMMHAQSEKEYLDAVCKIIVADCGHKMVWIGYAQEDETKSISPVAYDGFENGYLETLKLTWADTERGRGPTGIAIRTGKPSSCKNMQTDPNFAPWRAEALKRGYSSSLVLPMIAEGRTFGAITIYSADPDPFSEKEIKLLSELAEHLVYGVTAIRQRIARATAEEALSRSEKLYRTLFNSMTEGFGLHEIICDENGLPCNYRYIDVNPAFETLTGLKRASAIGRLVTDLLPGIEPYWISSFGKVALTGEPIHFESYAGPLNRYYEVFAYSPAYQQFAVLFIDTTDRKKLEQELQKQATILEKRVEERTYELASANQKLQEVLEREKTIRLQLVQSEKHTAMGRLLGSITHELNNPLQTIQNCLFLAQEGFPENSPYQEYITMANSEANRISALVSQVRDIYRPKPTEQKRIVHLGTIINEVHTLLLPHLSLEKVTWVASGVENAQMVWGNPDQIKQVFINMSINAIEAMRPDGGTLSIDMVTPEKSDMIRVTLQDTGPGIAPDNLSKVFEPFFTTRNTGVGLGLSICYDIIHSMGGNITVENLAAQGQNHGAVFTIWLPLSGIKKA